MAAQQFDPPSGTRDFLADEVRRREHVFSVIREVYERHGFEPLQTPAFERLELLSGKYGDEGDKLVFKILRPLARPRRAALPECSACVLVSPGVTAEG